MHDHRHTRSAFLAGAAGAAATLLPGVRASGQAAPPRRFIDIHHHFYPPELLAIMNAWQSKHALPPVGALFTGLTAEKSLAEMDAAGIAVSVLSLASPHGVWFEADPKAIPEIARACNEYAAKRMRDYPGRFGLLAAMPLPDVDAALKEVAYALDVLHADGIGIPTSFGNVWPGDAKFAPFWAELNRRKALVAFHPYAPNCCGGMQGSIGESLLEYPYDTGRAFVSLLFSGTLVKYPDVRYTFAHGGAALPVLAGRIQQLSGSAAKDVASVAPGGVDAMLRRMYFDTANATYPATMAALTKEVPVSQLMFGTDFPYVSGKQNIGPLDSDGLSPADYTAIAHGNAVRMFPRLRSVFPT